VVGENKPLDIGLVGQGKSHAVIRMAPIEALADLLMGIDPVILLDIPPDLPY